MGSPDVSRLSKPQREYFKNIEMQDGKKGYSAQEIDALAQALATGEIQGQGVEYAKGLINKFDFEQAKEAASDWVKNKIDNIMKMTGDKHSIDDTSELAALDNIINDPNSNPEDVAYAKAVRNMSQFAETSDLRNENTALRDENDGLRAENDELRATLEDTQAELKKTQEELELANETIETLKQDIDELKAENSDLAARLEKSLGQIYSLKKEKAALGAKLKGYQDDLRNGKISKEQFKELVEDIKKKADEFTQKMSDAAKDVTEMFKLPEFTKITQKKPGFDNKFRGALGGLLGNTIGASIGLPISGTVFGAQNANGTFDHKFGL